jgi:hypothetical protein
VIADSNLSKIVVDITPTDTVVLARHEDADIKLDDYLAEGVCGELDAYDVCPVVLGCKCSNVVFLPCG